MTTATDRPTYPAPAMFIDGEWTEGTSGEREPVFDPATKAVIGHVPHASAADLDRAIAAAARAFPVWSETPVARRAEVMARTRELMHARSREIARILTLEEGKSFTEAHGEVTRVADILRWDC